MPLKNCKTVYLFIPMALRDKFERQNGPLIFKNGLNVKILKFRTIVNFCGHSFRQNISFLPVIKIKWLTKINRLTQSIRKVMTNCHTYRCHSFQKSQTLYNKACKNLSTKTKQNVKITWIIAMNEQMKNANKTIGKKNREAWLDVVKVFGLLICFETCMNSLHSNLFFSGGKELLYIPYQHFCHMLSENISGPKSFFFHPTNMHPNPFPNPVPNPNPLSWKQSS